MSGHRCINLVENSCWRADVHWDLHSPRCLDLQPLSIQESLVVSFTQHCWVQG